MMRKLLVLVACLALFGCIGLPVESQQTTDTYILGSDGSLSLTEEITGTTTSTARQWPANCTSKLRTTLNGLIAVLQMGAGEMNETEQEVVNNMSQIVDLTNAKTTCSFHSNDGSGIFTIAMDLTYDDQTEIRGLLAGYPNEGDGPNMADILAARDSNGSYTFKIPAPTSDNESEHGEARIRVNGTVLHMTPGYTRDGEDYVYTDQGFESGDVIEITYARTQPTPTPTPTSTPSPSPSSSRTPGVCGPCLGGIGLLGAGLFILLMAQK